MQKAVIIGAGPAGLTAAYYLLKENTGIEPVVFESEAFVGGIARTAEFHGNRMDIGGHRFFSKNEEISSVFSFFFTFIESISFGIGVISILYFIKYSEYANLTFGEEFRKLVPDVHAGSLTI